MSKSAQTRMPDVSRVREAIRDGNLRHPEIRRFGRYLEQMLNDGRTYQWIAEQLGFSDASSVTRLRESAGLRERQCREVYSIYEQAAE